MEQGGMYEKSFSIWRPFCSIWRYRFRFGTICLAFLLGDGPEGDAVPFRANRRNLCRRCHSGTRYFEHAPRPAKSANFAGGYGFPFQCSRRFDSDGNRRHLPENPHALPFCRGSRSVCRWHYFCHRQRNFFYREVEEYLCSKIASGFPFLCPF